MKKWLKRIRGAVGMGLTWAVGWAIAGMLIGVASLLLPGLPWDSFFAVFDAPLPALAVPGFFGGALFSAVLGVVGRRRRFDELSLPRFAAWGAVGGLLLSLVPAAMVGVGLAHIGRDGLGLWQLTAVISGPLVLLSAASAAGSLMLARKTEGRGELAAGEDAIEVGLAGRSAQQLPEGTEQSLRGHPAAGPGTRVRPDAVRGPRDA
jgi:hypothetical protein